MVDEKNNDNSTNNLDDVDKVFIHKIVKLKLELESVYEPFKKQLITFFKDKNISIKSDVLSNEMFNELYINNFLIELINIVENGQEEELGLNYDTFIGFIVLLDRMYFKSKMTMRGAISEIAKAHKVEMYENNLYRKSHKEKIENFYNSLFN